MKRAFALLLTISLALPAVAETTSFRSTIFGYLFGAAYHAGLLNEWTCTPERCPRSVAETRMAACVLLPSKSNTEIENCLVKIAQKNPDESTLNSLLRALKLGWYLKPWGPGLHKNIFPLLNQKNREIRDLSYKWYTLDNVISRKPGLENAVTQDMQEIPSSPHGRSYYPKAIAAPPGIAQVGSDYRDESTSAIIRESGTGNVVSSDELSKNSHFILTAAHLVGGSNAWVRLGDKNLKIRSAIVDNDRDVALLEIEKADQVALGYSKTESLHLGWDLEQAIYRQEFFPADFGINYYPPVQKNVPEDARSMTMAKLLLNPWAEFGIESSEDRAGTEDASRGAIGLSYDRTKIRVSSKATGGTSGSFIYAYDFSIQGIVTQSNYYFSETYVERTQQILPLFEKFREGRRGNQSSTVWHLRNGTTYRDFGNGWQEANFIHQSTGSTLLADRGTSVLGDSGQGVLGDPGHGVLGDPGNGVLADPGTTKNFDPISRWRSTDPRKLFEQFGLRPGMTLNGKPIVGILAQAKRSTVQPRELFFYAEPMVLDFMRARDHDYNFVPIAEGADLSAFAARRFANAAPLEITHGAPLDPNSLNTMQPDALDRELNSVQMRDGKIEVSLRTFPARYVDDDARPMPDDISFVLDEKGCVNGSGTTAFLPIIEVTGFPSKTKYLVDIRRLLFNDLSGVSVNRFIQDEKEIQAEAERQLLLYGFTIRNVTSGLEFGFTFEQKKPPQKQSSPYAGTKK